jgi:ketosteroid isomerase-like protein
MSEHPNATIVRGAYEAVNRGDMVGSLDTLADDIVWYEIGRSEPRTGKAAVVEAMQASDVNIDVTIHDVLANDDHAVVLAEATATRDGKTLTYRVAEIVHLRDGKVTERWAFSDDTAAIVDFFA